MRLVSVLFALAFLIVPLFPAGSGGPAPADGIAPAAGTLGAEVISKRTAFSKHYRNDDGTWRARVWATPIHYRDDRGHWHDIDERPMPESQDPACMVANTDGDCERAASGVAPHRFLAPGAVLVATADPFPTLDSLVFQGNPDTQYSSDPVLGAQYDTVSGEIYTYIRWTTITDANYGTISGVVLQLKVSARSTPIPSAMVAVADVTSDWDSTVTWNTQPTNGGSPITSSFDVAPGNTQSWTGAALDTEVDSWRTDATSRNRGLALGFDSGAVDGDYVTWHSSDAASSADWPFISFTYANAGGGGGGGSGGCTSGSGAGVWPLLFLLLLLLLAPRRSV